MRRLANERGFTLIESMAAMLIMLVCALGLGAMFSIGIRMNGDARRITRATAIAQDLIDNIALWPYQDNVAGTPLANVKTNNDADIADTAFLFELDEDPILKDRADHGEADLTALGAAWTGIPSAELNGMYERYWNVAYLDANGNGVNEMVQVAVIVRWRQQGGLGWRRVVLVTAKLNPAGN
jgi:prepilin-type N-terminal cleavage/methylation domain-containing protein